ncbi:MAG: amino acid racemase [Oscillospiraceae bacterium]|nr:amino acid racemase [Oscillospiraceae bacterium]
MSRTAGILGGLGPAATVYFMDMLLRMTAAKTDQEHIDMLVMSRATTPDRTAYILGQSDDNPLPVMVEDARRLEQMGADFIVIPCNTAHYFYSEVQYAVTVPVINILEVTADAVAETVSDLRKVGILATEGTISAGAYQTELAKRGLDFCIPTADDQDVITGIIYKQVKAGLSVNIEAFTAVVGRMRAAGCDAIILGCTELSLINRDHGPFGADVFDSLELLAKTTVRLSGKPLKGVTL